MRLLRCSSKSLRSFDERGDRQRVGLLLVAPRLRRTADLNKSLPPKGDKPSFSRSPRYGQLIIANKRSCRLKKAL